MKLRHIAGLINPIHLALLAATGSAREAHCEIDEIFAIFSNASAF
jgi:hypothetical protein